MFRFLFFILLSLSDSDLAFGEEDEVATTSAGTENPYRSTALVTASLLGVCCCSCCVGSATALLELEAAALCCDATARFNTTGDLIGDPTGGVEGICPLLIMRCSPSLTIF